MWRFFLLTSLLSAPALATRGVPSEPLKGFKASEVFGVIYRNPADGIGVDPRFEPEQVDPSIRVEWTRDGEGRLWADVLYRNPDTGIFREMNERFRFMQRQDGDWQLIGRWSRWKCLGDSSPDWTLESCQND